MEDRIAIALAEQQLHLIRAHDGHRQWPVSTGAAGAGEQAGSGATPRGHHRIRAMIGAGASVDAVFVGRRPTGEIHSPALASRYPERDWILTRILWLCGCEPGRNRGGDVDTQRRLIYIHGTPADEPMGVPRSHGCIRMRSADIVALFAHCHPGMPVWIGESAPCLDR